MASKSFRSRSRDRKYRKYEYSSKHPRRRSIEKKYTQREGVSDRRDRSRDRKYRDHSPSYSRDRSYERRRDRRSHDRYSGKRDGRGRRNESHREERHRDSSDRHKRHRYNKSERSPSRSKRKKRFRSRSVSLGRKEDRRTPSEPSEKEKISVPAPPGEAASGSSPSGTSKDASKLSKGQETGAPKQAPNIDRTLTVMRDGKIITSAVAPIGSKTQSSVAATSSDNPLISGVKLDPETIAKRGLNVPGTKTNVEGGSNKDGPKEGSSTQDKGEKEVAEDIWKSFPPPKHYKKLTKYYDAVPKFGALAPSMYFPLDGAKLRRYKAYKSYNDKLRRYDDIQFHRKQLMNLVRFDFEDFKLKLELLKLNLTTSKLSYII